MSKIYNMKKYDKNMPCIKWITKEEFIEEEKRKKINADSSMYSAINRGWHGRRLDGWNFQNYRDDTLRNSSHRIDERSGGRGRGREGGGETLRREEQ